MYQIKNWNCNHFLVLPIMLVYKLQGSSFLSTFHVGYVALSQSMRDLVAMETLVIEVVTVVGQDTNILEFSNHSTVYEDNYGVVKVTHNHNLPIMTPVYNNIAIKYHWFIEKIYIGQCSVKNVDGKYQKANIFTRGLQRDILPHISGFFYGCWIKAL